LWKFSELPIWHFANMAYMLVISQILCVIMVNMWSGGS